MSRPTGQHRLGTYTTDCDCKGRYFRALRPAKQHMEACDRAGHVMYNPQIGEPRVVASKNE